MPTQKLFTTFDIALSAVLKISGFRLVSVDRQGSKAIFMFENKPESSEIVIKLANREMTVEPLRFMEEIRNLKSLAR